MNNVTEEILLALRSNEGPVSGQFLCDRIGITRTAVWKHVQTLRELGYHIEACRNQGYELTYSPNALNPAELRSNLRTETIGTAIKYFQRTDSTNNKAFSLASEGAPEGTVVVAEEQTRGKGRLTREWYSPPGENIYLSVVLRPERLPHEIPQLSLVAALSSIRAVKALYGDLPLGIKWPNDLFLGNRKFGGILCEMDCELDRTRYVVVGIGVNVNTRRHEYPSNVTAPVASLCERVGDGAIPRAGLCAEILGKFEEYYNAWCSDGLGALLKALNGLSWLNGRKISVEEGDCHIVRGDAQSIAEDGRLAIESEQGEIVYVAAGDVSVEERCNH